MATAARKSSPVSSLAKSLMAEVKSSPVSASEDKRYLSGVGEVPGMTSTDVEYAAAAAEVATLAVGEVLKAAAASLKAATVDASRVTLRTSDGKRVSLNLPVAYSLADGSVRYLNIGASLDGRVGEILAPYAQRVAKRSRD